MKNYNSNNLTLIRKRVVVLFIAAVFLFTVLFGRLAYIQLIQGRELQSRGAQQWYRDLPLAAPRGRILDTNGIVLADSINVYSVYVRPRAVTDRERVATELANALRIDRQRLFDRISGAAVSEITVARQVEQLIARRLINMRLDGVYFTVDTRRNFPEGDFLTQVLGFTNIDNVGQNGLEAHYNHFLRGINGFAYTPTDIRGVELDNAVTRYVPPIPGADITLTIDANIQSFAQEAVVSAHKQFNSKSASMLIMDARTGGILASAQTPSFDLNHVPRDDIYMLNQLSRNTLITDVFEPGSTFKIFTTALALEHGVVTDNTKFPCAGFRIVDGQRIRCWRTKGHGIQLLHEGVRNSCNCVFMDLALDIGVERFYDGIKGFGFGSKTGIDFMGESAGLLIPQNYVKNIDLARIGFGHAIAATPLQMVAAVAATVNGGNLMEPHFIQSARSGGTGIEFYRRQPNSLRRVISEQTSIQMREILEGVVSQGSGKKAGVPGFLVGGKTGTAQKYGEGGAIVQGKYVSSFIGFAPADNPRYVTIMIVDEPEGYMYYGSLVAAPFVGQVFDRIFQLRGMEGTEEVVHESVIMPELVGRTAEHGVGLLTQMGVRFETSGEGDRVIGTVPVATSIVNKNREVVLLRLG
ncbi:MAG: penicillin-binding transpeptidase domain-containing protein [Firmicutes bacterium]|nr:penicillin-binding transpeptidase domain-containing protein [Bacillota bacterium]